MFAWKDDVQLPVVLEKGGQETKGMRLARDIQGFEKMKTLRQIFQAAKSTKAMSTRKERQAVVDAQADAHRLAAADTAFANGKGCIVNTLASQGQLNSDATESIQVDSPLQSRNGGQKSSFGEREASLASVNENEAMTQEDCLGQLSGDANGSGQLQGVIQSASFSLADYINEFTDDQDEMSLPNISFEACLDDVSQSARAAAMTDPHYEDDDEESQDVKALKLQTRTEANRRIESRRRLLLEYAHKIELAQVNTGLDAKILFMSMDTNGDGRLGKDDLDKGLRVLQIKIDRRSRFIVPSPLAAPVRPVFNVLCPLMKCGYLSVYHHIFLFYWLSSLIWHDICH